MSERESLADRLERLGREATPVADASIVRYDHGGGRAYLTTSEAGGETRELIADFYSESDRELFWLLRNSTEEIIAALRLADADGEISAASDAWVDACHPDRSEEEADAASERVASAHDHIRAARDAYRTAKQKREGL